MIGVQLYPFGNHEGSPIKLRCPCRPTQSNNHSIKFAIEIRKIIDHTVLGLQPTIINAELSRSTYISDCNET